MANRPKSGSSKLRVDYPSLEIDRAYSGHRSSSCDTRTPRLHLATVQPQDKVLRILKVRARRDCTDYGVAEQFASRPALVMFFPAAMPPKRPAFDRRGIFTDRKRPRISTSGDFNFGYGQHLWRHFCRCVIIRPKRPGAPAGTCPLDVDLAEPGSAEAVGDHVVAREAFQQSERKRGLITPTALDGEFGQWGLLRWRLGQHIAMPRAPVDEAGRRN
jgi:hypothetical protein